MSQDTHEIQVRGARVHNLASVDLDLPRGQIVAFCGVSGSGKSSLAFDTLYAEGQRRMTEALPPRVRLRLGGLPKPDVDLISGLPPTLGVSANPGAGGPRSTIATRAEIHDLLRALWAHRGEARCPRCGVAMPVTSAQRVAASLGALPEGTRLTLLAPVARRRPGGLGDLLDEMLRLGFARCRVDGEIHRLEDRPVVDARLPHDVDLVVDRVRVSAAKADRLLEAVGTAMTAGKGRMGVLVAAEGNEREEERFFADHPYCQTDDLALPLPTPALFSFNTSAGACPRCDGLGVLSTSNTPDPPLCPDCEGSRLGPTARAFEVGGRSLSALLGQPLAAALRWASDLQLDPAIHPMLLELVRRLFSLERLGLGPLSLGRSTDTLCTGEARRLHLAAQSSGELSGLLYVLDEPSAGLARGETEAVLALIRELRALGNTVLVVTHDPLLIAAADQVVDFGPGAGASGGRVIFQGTPEALAAEPSPTGRALSGRLPAPEPRARRDRGHLHLRGARVRGAHPRDLRFPLQALSVLTGPSGSGKTALLEETLGRALAARLHRAQAAPHPFDALEGAEGILRVIRLSRGPLGRSQRSCTATVAGIWSPVRRLFAETREARIRGLKPEYFSFNRPGGRCEACEGTGIAPVRLALMPEASAPCEVCEGRRFHPSALTATWRGATIAEVLGWTVSEARRVMGAHAAVEGPLRALEQAGLGYLPLGQRADTLSGGEGQRVRLARALGSPGETAGALYLLDHPAAGLHPADVDPLVSVLHSLVDQGATVLCEEIDPRMLAAADQVVVL